MSLNSRSAAAGLRICLRASQVNTGFGEVSLRPITDRSASARPLWSTQSCVAPAGEFGGPSYLPRALSGDGIGGAHAGVACHHRSIPAALAPNTALPSSREVSRRSRARNFTLQLLQVYWRLLVKIISMTSQPRGALIVSEFEWHLGHIVKDHHRENCYLQDHTEIKTFRIAIKVK